MTIPLDPREGRRLYGENPEAYSLGRPDYPPRVYEVLTESGMGQGCRVLEIGPGSGLVTRHLLEAGGHVTAVEASDQMATHLAVTFDSPSLRVIYASFEEAKLPAGSFDLVVAATSFHWVAQPAGWENLRQSLGSGGWAVIWWMLFEDPTEPDDFDRASQELLGGSPALPDQPNATPFQIDVEVREADLKAAGLIDVESELIRATYRLSSREVRALYATMAIVLRRPAAEQEALLNEIERLVENRHGGRIERRFLTALYRGRKPA